MAKASLLGAVCTVAMLAATPVLAQTSTQPGDTTGGAASTSATPGTMAPAGSDSRADADTHSTHRSTMEHHHAGSVHARRTDTSQSAAVDRLNEQSYEAAQKGQAFGSADTAAPPPPSGSGSTNDLSGGSPAGNGTTSGGKM